jgi:autoinducer 2 (AI-2) kinase
MFTGKVNAMEKAMAGELHFAGDAAKAMTLQLMQSDLSRLYRKAREDGGDPGDLEQLAKKAKGTKRKPQGAMATAGVAGPIGRAKVGDERDDLVQVVDELYSSRLITATGGNVSMRVGTHPDAELWITPSTLFKGDLRPEILVRINIAEGKALDEDAMSPSSERLMHCAVYKNRPEARAVIHAHAPNATILANTGLPFLPISTEAAFFGNIPRVPFIMPGTPGLADAVGKAIKESWAVLLQNHGLIVAGRTLRRAADNADIIERAAEIILGCYAVGKEPPVLPEDVVKTLRQMGELVA